MRKVLFLFADLSDADVEWLAAAGERQSIPEGSVLIRQGETIRVVYILLDGQLSVHLEHRPERIATLQRGEIVGELSFLDARPPSATVTAATDSIVLAISRDKLRGRLERDTAFAAKFYRALGVFLSVRLRSTMKKLRSGQSDSPQAEDQVAEEITPQLLGSVAIAARRFELLVERTSRAKGRIE